MTMSLQGSVISKHIQPQLNIALTYREVVFLPMGRFWHTEFATMETGAPYLNRGKVNPSDFANIAGRLILALDHGANRLFLEADFSLVLCPLLHPVLPRTQTRGAFPLVLG